MILKYQGISKLKDNLVNTLIVSSTKELHGIRPVGLMGNTEMDMCNNPRVKYQKASKIFCLASRVITLCACTLTKYKVKMELNRIDA